MPLTTMKETFVHELEDAYDAEHQFLEAQRQMAEKAAEPTLLKGLQKHIIETEQQIKILEQVFAELGESPQRQPCDGAKGLISEAQKMMEEAGVEEIRDSLIGSAAAKAESYEVNAYTGMVTSAELMGQPKVARLLQKNLRQEERMQAALEKREEPLLRRAMKATGELNTGSPK
jgi:ferritin-like metal-binding protein YciE